MTRPRLIHEHPETSPSLADAVARLRHVFVRDLVLEARIGVWRREKKGPQRIRVNVDLAVREGDRPLDDKLANVLRYDEIAAGVRRIVVAGHVNLVETLAERIAAMALEHPGVRSVRVRVEKLDALPDAASVGVEIERRQA